MPIFFFEARTDFTSHAPDLVDINKCKDAIALIGVERADITHTVPSAADVFLGEVVRHFGQRFRRANPNAGWDTHPLQDLRANAKRVSGQVEAKSAKVEKTFIDRVDLLHGRVLANHRHHAIAQVRVERVV
jgi:hypothetical protein